MTTCNLVSGLNSTTQLSSVSELWSIICERILRSRVGSLFDVSIFIHFASKSECLVPKSVTNMSKFTFNVAKFIIVIMQIFMWCVVIDVCYMFNFICVCPAPLMLHLIPHVTCLNAFMMCFKKLVISFNSLLTWAKIAHSVYLFAAHSWRYGMREYICMHSAVNICVIRSKLTFDIWSVLLVSYWHVTSLWSNFHDIPYLQEVKYIKLKFTNHPCFITDW